MFAGHFGISAIVKAKYPEAPLWALMLSTQLLDVFFVPLFISGIETVKSVEGVFGYGGSIIHADYTHSFVGALLIAIIAALLARWRWGNRIGYIIGSLVISHWFLDLMVHRSDLPILPGNLGNLSLLGFGLWQFPLISVGLESILIVIGTILYTRSALNRAKATNNNISKAIVAGTVMGLLLVLSLGSDWMSIG